MNRRFNEDISGVIYRRNEFIDGLFCVLENEKTKTKKNLLNVELLTVLDGFPPERKKEKSFHFTRKITFNRAGPLAEGEF